MSDKPKERELTGPECPCGKPKGIRRRRYWAQWDTAKCKHCGRVVECIDARRLMFSFAPAPTKRRNA